MAASGEDVGCWLVGGLLIAAGIWAYDRYEITRKADPPTVTIPPLSPKPTGLIRLTELKDGSVWHLDADTVKGPRTKRLAWVVEDHSKNKKVKANRTLTFYTIDCETTGYMTNTVVEYAKDGAVLGSWPASVFSKEPSYPPPGSNIGEVVGKACDWQFDPPPALEGSDEAKSEPVYPLDACAGPIAAPTSTGLDVADVNARNAIARVNSLEGWVFRD